MKVCDTFVFLDDAQMPGGSYVSRTKVRCRGADEWLSVPTSKAGSPPIRDVVFADQKWASKHLRILEQEYRKAPFFGEVLEMLTPIYRERGTHLAEFNERLIRVVAAYLGLAPSFVRSSDLGASSTGDQRNADLVRLAGGDTYVSGPGGMKYQHEDTFQRSGIHLEVRQYQPIGYEAPGYGFIPALSIVDALFIKGKTAADLLEYPSPSPETSCPAL
jgi:hypothetical protein